MGSSGVENSQNSSLAFSLKPATVIEPAKVWTVEVWGGLPAGSLIR